MKRVKKSFFNFLFLVIFTLQASAETATKTKKSEEKEVHVGQSQNVVESTLIEANKGVSSTFDSLSNRIDIMLSGEKYTNKKNKSAIIVKNGAYASEGEQVEYATRFDIRLRLPNLEEKWSLRFTSYDEEEEERGINSNRPRTQPPRQNYGASIAVIKKLGDINVSFKPRVRIRDTLETSHLLKFESVADMKHYSIRPRLELFARAEDGTGELFGLDFEFDLTDNLTIVQSNAEEYVDNQNRLSVTNELALHQILNERKSLKYAFLYQSNNKPNFHLESYGPYVSFVHSLYKNMVHYSVTPRLTYSEGNHFRPHWGAVVGVDLIF